MSFSGFFKRSVFQAEPPKSSHMKESLCMCERFLLPRRQSLSFPSNSLLWDSLIPHQFAPDVGSPTGRVFPVTFHYHGIDVMVFGCAPMCVCAYAHTKEKKQRRQRTKLRFVEGNESLLTMSSLMLRFRYARLATDFIPFLTGGTRSLNKH